MGAQPRALINEAARREVECGNAAAVLGVKTYGPLFPVIFKVFFFYYYVKCELAQNYISKYFLYTN